MNRRVWESVRRARSGLRLAVVVGIFWGALVGILGRVLGGCAADPAAPPVVLGAIAAAAAAFPSQDPALELLLRNGLRSTSRNAFAMEDGTVYVKTGDIPAEWLRDSSVQVQPYLLFVDDPEVAAFLRGVIE